MIDQNYSNDIDDFRGYVHDIFDDQTLYEIVANEDRYNNYTRWMGQLIRSYENVEDKNWTETQADKYALPNFQEVLLSDNTIMTFNDCMMCLMKT